MTDLRVRVSGERLGPVAPLRWVGWAFLGAAAVLLPWTVVLGISLPATASVRHWAVAWMGLDLMETLALAVTGWLIIRQDMRVGKAASAAGAFLLADAWFDITTAQPSWDVLQATMLAVFVELPLIVLCATVAVTAPRWWDVADRPD
jgi:hypothetical protein